MTGAIVVFTKTLGVSPVKSRLAKDVGTACADEFFELSLKAIEESVEQICVDLNRQGHSFMPIWSVAENKALKNERWSEWKVQAQTPDEGKYELGERLNYVYSQLESLYDVIFFIGVDSPQITSEHFSQALMKLKKPECQFAIGPSDNGGYYLFAGGGEIPESVWLETPYGVSITCEEFIHRLSPSGEVQTISSLIKVDDLESLKKLQKYWKQQELKMPMQKYLKGFVSKVLSKPVDSTDK